ncbi:MAG TPA: PAS domain-containing protein [Candidatus Limnocylindrales bacterium]|nr:PAS domain-containing protein [Candidatus Limnocylindrales bacterium]
MRATQVREVLQSWRDAERRWEATHPDDPDYEQVRNAVAEPWLAYQEASGSVAADELVLVADDRMRYVAANETAHRVLGYPSGGLIGRSIADVTAPGDVEAAAAAWATFLRLGRLDGEYRLVTADGRAVPVVYLARAHQPVAGLHVSRLRVIAPTPSEQHTSGAG